MKPLTVAGLEAGLERLTAPDLDASAFWEENGEAFTATLRLAVRETADALLFGSMSSNLREELEAQLQFLTRCLENQQRGRGECADEPLQGYPSN